MAQLRPVVPITDPRFVYTPSHKTDVRERFRLVKMDEERQAQEELQQMIIDAIRHAKELGLPMDKVDLLCAATGIERGLV